MRKYLLADITKAVESEAEIERKLRIKYLMDEYDIKEKDAEKIVDEYDDYSIQDLVAKSMENYSLDLKDAIDFVENHPNESTWGDLEETAEALNIGIEDVEDDDVEYVMDGAGAKGQDDSSIGIIQWLYDNTLKAYIVYIALTNNSDLTLEPQDVIYRIEPDLMQEWKDASSMGEYYNNNIRSNKALEDPAISCGCGPNPCEQGQIDQFNTKYNNLP